MKAPYLTERVRVEGSDQPYFVIKVDEELQVAELMPVWGAGPCLEDVPFLAIRRNSEVSTQGRSQIASGT